MHRPDDDLLGNDGERGLGQHQLTTQFLNGAFEARNPLRIAHFAPLNVQDWSSGSSRTLASRHIWAF